MDYGVITFTSTYGAIYAQKVLLPWLLRIAGVVLLIKALLDKPTRWENFMPAVVAFALSLLIGWIF